MTTVGLAGTIGTGPGNCPCGEKGLSSSCSCLSNCSCLEGKLSGISGEECGEIVLGTEKSCTTTVGLAGTIGTGPGNCSCGEKGLACS